MEHKPIVKAMEKTHNKLNRGRSYFGMGYVDSYDLLETEMIYDQAREGSAEPVEDPPF